jgi:hypothetical protein
MKNILIAGSVILLYTTTANAQSESGTGKDEKETKAELRKTEREANRNDRNVSYQSNQAFLRDFPDADNVNWRTVSFYEVAEFNNKGTITKAYYDMDNELVGTTTEKAFSDIPLVAQKHIKKNYSSYTPENVILFDDNEYNDTDMELYGTTFDDEDNYFVSLKKDKETIVLKVNTSGDVSFFKKL